MAKRYVTRADHRDGMDVLAEDVLLDAIEGFFVVDARCIGELQVVLDGMENNGS